MNRKRVKGTKILQSFTYGNNSVCSSVVRKKNFRFGIFPSLMLTVPLIIMVSAPQVQAMGCAGYEAEVRTVINTSPGFTQDDTTYFVLDYHLYRSPQGISRFPDGGQSKTVFSAAYLVEMKGGTHPMFGEHPVPGDLSVKRAPSIPGARSGQPILSVSGARSVPGSLSVLGALPDLAIPAYRIKSIRGCSLPPDEHNEVDRDSDKLPAGLELLLGPDESGTWLLILPHDSLDPAGYSIARVSSVSHEDYTLRGDVSINEISRLVKSADFEALGLPSPLDFCRKNPSGYRRDIVELRGDINYRKAIIEALDISPDEASLLLGRMEKHQETLSGSRAMEYEIFSEETRILLQDIIRNKPEKH